MKAFNGDREEGGGGGDVCGCGAATCGSGNGFSISEKRDGPPVSPWGAVVGHVPEASQREQLRGKIGRTILMPARAKHTPV